MEQYIKKSILVSEIENLLKPIKQRLERDKNDPWDSDIAVYKFGIQLIKNIDTLEVKEVDLNEEIKSYFKGFGKFASVGIDDCIDIAKHFFELGITASNKA